VAQALQEELGLETQLVSGGGGVFRVELDGWTVFERRLGLKIPEPEEFVRMVADRAGRPTSAPPKPG
jgi:predicted Rdx family selenoprotein